jgi:nitrate reductase molybdenum cofactor assembly chaperone NarJ/NarW
MVTMNENLTNQFAALLEYPTPALARQVNACLDSLNPVQPAAAEELTQFQSSLQQHSQAQIEELYTRTFDMQPVCYPYIGYQLFGESYKRGAFMARLVEGYRLNGFDAGKELPDHVSVVLRFLAHSPEAWKSDFGQPLLLEALLPALEKMAQALAGNPYQAILSALLLFLASVRETEMVHA